MSLRYLTIEGSKPNMRVVVASEGVIGAGISYDAAYDGVDFISESNNGQFAIVKDGVDLKFLVGNDPIGNVVNFTESAVIGASGEWTFANPSDEIITETGSMTFNFDTPLIVPYTLNVVGDIVTLVLPNVEQICTNPLSIDATLVTTYLPLTPRSTNIIRFLTNSSPNNGRITITSFGDITMLNEVSGAMTGDCGWDGCSISWRWQ